MQHCTLAAAFFTVVLLPSAAMAEVRAGAAKRVITPDLKLHGPVYMAGFDHNRKATGIHDDLLYAAPPSQPALARWCSAEQISSASSMMTSARSAPRSMPM